MPVIDARGGGNLFASTIYPPNPHTTWLVNPFVTELVRAIQTCHLLTQNVVLKG